MNGNVIVAIVQMVKLIAEIKQRQFIYRIQLLMAMKQESFTPRNLELSAWRISSFMSTSVFTGTGQVSMCKADSSI